MLFYVVESLHAVTISAGSPIDGMDLMSPFVWLDGSAYRMLLRGVPQPLLPSDPTGVIASGSSIDGLNFTIDEWLAIIPGTDADDPDAGGCEDPTVWADTKGGYHVFYTGVDLAQKQGCMMLAKGQSVSDLIKRKVVIRAPEGEGNIKEATLVKTPVGDWRMFYEYASGNASRVGLAAAKSVEGPWHALADPFDIRKDSWDRWHLSTGPILSLPGRDPVMFYNGATEDARWRIGWITFNSDFTSVTGRGVEPLIMPPPPTERSAVDIAFAASAIHTSNGIDLYYSLEDRMLRRASIAIATSEGPAAIV